MSCMKLIKKCHVYLETAYQVETKLERGARVLKDWTSVWNRSSSFDFLLSGQRFQRQRISTVWSMSSMLCWAIKSRGRRTRVEAEGNLKPAANEGKARETVKKASFKQPAIQVRITLRAVCRAFWLGLLLFADLAARLASEPCTLRWMGMKKNTLMLQRHSVLSSKPLFVLWSRASSKAAGLFLMHMDQQSNTN